MNGKTVSPLQRLVFTALFSALICVTTLVIQIPSPIGGYVNLGDCMILFAAFLLGPWWGLQPAAIGSALADIIGAYFLFAPGTAVVKGLTAIVAGLLFRAIRGRSLSLGWTLVAAVIGGVAGELVMTGGYFLYESLILGYGWGAVGEIPGNLAQGAAGVILSTALYAALSRVGSLQRLFLVPDSRESKE